MSNGSEPVAELRVDVSAKIDRAERDLRQFEQRLDRAASRSQQLATQVEASGKRTAAAASSTDRLTTSLKGADQAMTGLEKAIATANRNAAKAERDEQRLADAKIRGAIAARDYGRALEMLADEQQRAGAGSLRFAQLETQKTRVMDQATRAAERQQRATQAQRAVTETFRGSAMALAGTLGLTTAGSIAFAAVVQRMTEGFKLAAQLDQNRRSLNTLIGDQQRGNQVFETAIRFGQEYGFTQREMGTSAQAAALLMKDSTTAAEKQFEVLARLASLNADEGIAGATFATKELASGDIESIVERFNLGRAAANRMKAEVASGKDVFQVLDAELNRMNVTVEVLKNRMEGAAGAMYRAQQANENLTLALGRLAESKGAVDLVNALATGLNNVARSLDYGGQLQQFNNRVFEGADSFAEYLARLNQVNAAIPSYLSKIPALTEVQYAYAQSLREGGMATDEAIAKARGLGELAGLIQNNFNPAAAAAGNAFQHLGIGIEAIPQAGAVAKQTLQDLGPQILNLAAGSDAARMHITALVQQLIDGTLTVPVFRAEIERLTLAQQADAAVTAQAAFRKQELATANQAATDASAEAAAALENEATKALLADAQSQQLAQTKETLRQQALAAAQGVLASGDASEAAMRQMAAQTGVAYELIAALVGVEQQARRTASAQAYQQAYADYRAGERDLAAGRSPLGAAAAEQQNRAAEAAQAQLAKERQAQAERAAKQAATAANKAARADAAAARKAQTEANRAARDQAEHEKARLALLSDQERLLELQKKLSTNLGDTERLELLKDIRDLEKKIADERERQVKAAIDARLMAIDDRKKRRQEAKEAEQARRVLASAGASEEMRQAARDVLERITLEQQKRAEEITSKQRDAGATAAPSAPVAAPSPSTAPIPATPSSITSMPVGTPSLVAPPAPQAGSPQPIVAIDVSVYLDSAQIAAAMDARISTGLNQSRARGKGAA